MREHSEEILNAKCLEYSSPSWARSVFANAQAIKWAKAKVYVHAGSAPDHGNYRDDNSSGGSVHVRVCRVRRWRNRVRQRKRANDHQRKTSWSAVGSKCTGTHRHARDNANDMIEKGETNKDMGAPSR